MYIFAIFMCLVWGYCCSLIADSKGYSKNWAWFWGIIFGLLAVIVYLCLGTTENKRKDEVKKMISEIQQNEKIN